MSITRSRLIEPVSKIVTENSWSFDNLTQKDTNYLTHCYHRYPAKFIPQLARRLILENSQERDIICDPFYGSGSTILESILHNRVALGTDINPIAHMITLAKTTPLDPSKISNAISFLHHELKHSNTTADYDIPQELSKWFDDDTYYILNHLLSKIKQIKPKNLQLFFLCAFSHILKTSSYWNNGSVKPHKDKTKFLNRVNDPITRYFNQLKKMEIRNEQLINTLSPKILNNLDYYRRVYVGDLQDLPKDEECSLIVTSPPYVISYEYRDIHSLSLSFLQDFFKDIPSKQNFIGSSHRKTNDNNLYSYTGGVIADSLHNHSKALSKTVYSYFIDMQNFFHKSYDLLKTNGKMAVVIGNTALRGVDISNTQVFDEILATIGFTEHKIIKRKIPFKCLPTTRDPKTGRFVSSATSHNKSYSHEYIMIYSKT